jgi:hypothetical protein
MFARLKAWAMVACRGADCGVRCCRTEWTMTVEKPMVCFALRRPGMPTESRLRARHDSHKCTRSVAGCCNRVVDAKSITDVRPTCGCCSRCEGNWMRSRKSCAACCAVPGGTVCQAHTTPQHPLAGLHWAVLNALSGCISVGWVCSPRHRRRLYFALLCPTW